MTPTCDLPLADLVAYADGELRPARRELVEAHQQVCPVCQQRLAAFRAVDHVLRDASPLRDDPGSRVALRARLAREASRQSGHVVPRVVLTVFIGGLLGLLLAIAWWPTMSQAHAGLSRFFRPAIQPLRQGLPLGQEPPGTPIVGVRTLQPTAGHNTLDTVELARLPLDLTLVERSPADGARRDLLYRNPAGLVILLTQEPAHGVMGSVTTGGGVQSVVVRDTEVLWLQAPQPGAVARLIWERQGVLCQALVLEAPPQGLPFADARQVVEALIAAQERAR